MFCEPSLECLASSLKVGTPAASILAISFTIDLIDHSASLLLLRQIFRGAQELTECVAGLEEVVNSVCSNGPFQLL